MARESGMDKGKADDDMKASGKGAQGGTHEQHVKAGQQSHKNSGSSASGSDKGANKNMAASSGSDPKKTDKSSHTQGGTHDQHVKAGQQNHKNTSAKNAMDDDEEEAPADRTRGTRKD